MNPELLSEIAWQARRLTIAVTLGTLTFLVLAYLGVYAGLV